MNTYKSFVISLAALLLFFTTAQAQESYRFEVGAVHHYSEDDDDIEVTVRGLAALFTFNRRKPMSIHWPKRHFWSALEESDCR